MDTECSTSLDGDTPTPDSPATGPPRRLRFSLRSLLICLLVICALLAALVPQIRYARRSAQRMQCRNKLRQIGLALHNYRDVFKTFPWGSTYAADGTPMRSWRVAVLPYIESNVVWGPYDYKKPWNSPANIRLEEFGICYFRCPSAPRSQNRFCTNYAMLIDDRPGKPNGPPNRPGSVPPSYDPRSAVIVIEVADSAIHWMEPRDVLLSELSMKINDRSQRSLSSYHGGACVVHADGSAELLDDATTEERVRELLTQ